jgi:UDP-N-acetyl-D-glucosamine dehydrogenase
LPLACLAAEKGFAVTGYDVDRRKINRLASGRIPFGDSRLARWYRKVSMRVTADPAGLAGCGIFIICVPTPVDQRSHPDLGPVLAATETAGRFAPKGSLVILESTVNPGVCEEVVVPALERLGRRVGQDLSLAHCPERINPGDPRWTVRNIPRVLGATDGKGLKRALAFYRKIIQADVKPMASIRAAEAVKIVENAFRDVNIAFVNELARSFDRLGIDVVEVIEGARTKPFAFLAHYPSCGIGGHCIPVDPYYLIERAKRSGFDHRFLRLARETNDAMPGYTVDLLIRALRQRRRSLRGAKIGVLGVAYKANIDDVRESPAFKILHRLKEFGARPVVYDPHVPSHSTVHSLPELLKQVSALLLVTDHAPFLRLTPERVRANGIDVVVDGKNALNAGAFRRAHITYQGIGR